MADKKLVFATNNPHKLNEVKVLVGKDYEIVSLADIGCQEDMPETADTLEGNASQKASYIFTRYGLDCFADDTGLEVEALNGRPGVKSARYAGDENNPLKNIELLLSELDGKSNRKARFRTVIALIQGGEETRFEGIVQGKIILEKKGEGGFGYDSVFIPDGYDMTFAEMPLKLKNVMSHRARAIHKLVSYLKLSE